MDAARHDSAIVLPTNLATIYEPLEPDEIRLLLLEPGSGDEALQGSLQTVDLYHAPSYCALSYAWGTEEQGHLMLPGRQKLQLKKSLQSALVAMRRTDKTIVLWADAICINQRAGPENNDEKNAQVALMTEIYKRAFEVRVWLGNFVESSVPVFQVLHLLHEYAVDYRQCYDLVDKMDDDEKSRCYEEYTNGSIGGLRNPVIKTSEAQEMYAHFKALSTSTLLRYLPRHQSQSSQAPSQENNDNEPGLRDRPVDLHEGLIALDPIWGSAWFGRFWIIQEVAMAKAVRFYCNTSCIPWQHLVEAADMTWSLAQWTVLDGVGVRDILGMVAAAKGVLVNTVEHFLDGCNPCKISELLAIVKIPFVRDCLSKSHDRIYAARALSRVIEHSPLLTPNYDLETSKLWRRFAESVLHVRDYLETSPTVILALVGTQWEARSPDLPSWVPDMETMNLESSRKASFYMQHSLSHCAGGQSMWQDVKIDPDDPKVLILRGALCFKVDKVLPRSQRRSLSYKFEFPSLEEYKAEVKIQMVPHYMHCYKFAKQYATVYEVLEDEFSQLMAHGQDLYPRDGSWMTYERARVMIETYAERAPRKNGDLVGVEVDIKRMTEDLLPFLEPDLPNYSIDGSRLLASTTDGWVGWVPATTQPDDYIFVLEGAPFPFVLRYHEDGHYKLLGDAWIQGIQHAEGWPTDEKHVRTIRVC